MGKEIEFDKYKKRGAYHWKDFNRNSAYRNNALFIRDWIPGGYTLDIGAGDGVITSLLGNAIGIDNNELAVSMARKRDVNVITGNAYHLPFPGEIFDNVLMGDVLEHLEHDQSAIMEVCRVLKPLGKFFIVTPPKIAPKNKYHYREYSPGELVELMHHFKFQKKGSTAVETFVLHGNISVRKELNRMYAVFQKEVKK